MSFSVLTSVPSRRTLWLGLLMGVGAALGIAVLTPVFGPGLRAVVMEGFSSVCHQMPSRSPHLRGVSLAICDRCLGIYGGLVLGIGAAGWTRVRWSLLAQNGKAVLIGGLVPVALDWVGPLLGVWGNDPESRALTGGLAGLVVGGVVALRLLRPESGGEEGTE